MNNFKKLCIFLLAFSLILPIFSNIKAKADEINIETTYNIKVKEKLTLKSSFKNPTWGSTDITIATVNSKGVIKGKKVGTCIISATKNNKTELFLVNVTKKSKTNKLDNFTIKNDTEKGNYTENDIFAYIGNQKIIFYKTTFDEVINSINKTNYSYKCDYISTDLTTNNFYIDVYDKSTLVAKIYMAINNSTVLVKDSLVKYVRLYLGAPTDCYYFNNNFKTSNIPKFENINNLISKDINYDIQDYPISTSNTYIYNPDNNSINGKSCIKYSIYFYKELNYDYAIQYNSLANAWHGSPTGDSCGNNYTLNLYFNKSTHECIGILLD